MDFTFTRPVEAVLAEYGYTPDQLNKMFVPAFDLGEIRAPDAYNHVTWLDVLRQKWGGEFKICNRSITHEHFREPSTVLMPCDKLKVEVYVQANHGYTDWKARLAFLLSRNAALVGPQGLALLFDRKMEEGKPKGLPKWRPLVSMDRPERLWRPDDNHRVSTLKITDRGHEFDLRSLEPQWTHHDLLVFFTRMT